MVRRLMLVAAVALLSASAQAQRGPCGGGSPNPMFTVLSASPVVLNFQHALSFYTLTTPVVTFNGNDISVAQFMLVPPAQLPLPPTNTCNQQSISLGVLPPGTYTVTWSYQDFPSQQPIQTFHYVLTVPSAIPAMSQPSMLALMFLCAAIGVVMLRK